MIISGGSYISKMFYISVTLHVRFNKILKIFLSIFSFAKKKKRLRATDAWYQDMLEIGCDYSILNRKRINHKICFVFEGVDNTGVFYRSRDKVVPLK